MLLRHARSGVPIAESPEASEEGSCASTPADAPAASPAAGHSGNAGAALVHTAKPLVQLHEEPVCEAGGASGSAAGRDCREAGRGASRLADGPGARPAVDAGPSLLAEEAEQDDSQASKTDGVAEGCRRGARDMRRRHCWRTRRTEEGRRRRPGECDGAAACAADTGRLRAAAGCSRGGGGRRRGEPSSGGPTGRHGEAAARAAALDAADALLAAEEDEGEEQAAGAAAAAAAADGDAAPAAGSLEGLLAARRGRGCGGADARCSSSCACAAKRRAIRACMVCWILLTAQCVAVNANVLQ